MKNNIENDAITGTALVSDDDRVIAKRKILDILCRFDNDRPTEIWHSDIRRMTDMLLWLYKEWSKPMTYPDGDKIVFNNTEDTVVAYIEKRDGDYYAMIDDCEYPLGDITDSAVLWPLLKQLIWKEFQQWDYCVDLAAYYRPFDKELQKLFGDNEARLYTRADNIW